MANSNITLTSGDKLQTYLNTIAASSVHAEAVALVDVNGNPISTRNISDTPINSDTGIITHAVVYGHTTAGGGSYVEVKVAPSGALQTDSSGTTQPVSGPLTDTQLRATPVPVSGTFWQSTQPVNGTITANQGGTWNIGSISSNINVAGTVGATQSGDWTVKQSNAANFLATVAGNVTAAQSNASNFLATIVGTVTANQSNASNLLVTASQGGTWNIGTITTLPTNASFNETQVLGTTIDVNAGNASAGTQRVVLASNQPNVPIVDAGGSLTVDGTVSLSANSSFNLTQVLGTTVGVAAGGVQKSGIIGGTGASLETTNGVLDTNLKRVADGVTIASVTGVQDVMPRRRDGATGLSPVYYAGRITTKTTTTVTAGTAYVSVMKVLCSNAGTAATLNINDINRTLFAFNIPGGAMSVGGNYESYADPIKFISGINIVTGGTTMGDCNVAITYWQ